MEYILDLGKVFTLIILIGLRLILKDGSWMVAIQYVGLGVAYADLVQGILTVTLKTKIFKKVLAMIILGMLIYIVVALLGSFRIVESLTSSKTLDVVTLGTLLISLPQKLYLNLLKER